MRRLVQIAVILFVGVVSVGQVIAEDDILCDFEDQVAEVFLGDSVHARSFDSAAAGNEAAIGDINCNGIAYEIADAVMFSNYFVNGPGAFGSHVMESTEASETNRDHRPLMVADFVYLIRVIVGDALPYRYIHPVEARVTVYTYGVISVDEAMGAALIVVRGDVTPRLLASGMEMKSAFDGNNTNVLVYSIDGNSFEGDFIHADGPVNRMEFGDFMGRPVRLKRMLADWELHQNYPNPFNRTTTIKMDIPVRGAKWEVSIYNITGQLVRSYSGVTTTGFETVTWDAEGMASGVYFYQLRAGGYTFTRRMMFLK